MSDKSKIVNIRDAALLKEKRSDNEKEYIKTLEQFVKDRTE